jgi:hypothetical protein
MLYLPHPVTHPSVGSRASCEFGELAWHMGTPDINGPESQLLQESHVPPMDVFLVQYRQQPLVARSFASSCCVYPSVPTPRGMIVILATSSAVGRDSAIRA